MKNTVVGLFENRTDAQRAQSEIVSLNIPLGDTKVFDQTSSTETGESGQSWWDSVKETFGFGSSEDRQYYEEGLRRGGILVSVRADESLVDRVTAIMSEHGAFDIDERAEQWRSSGWTPETGTPAATRTSGSASQEGATMPVVEEQLKVGKREVGRRGVRVYRQVTEQPVEETVRLRDETVRVERRPADRPVTESAGLFQEETIDITETHEEPVVSKQARVVEEVTLSRDVREREETVRDTVRRSDVRAESTTGTAGTGQPALDDEECRRHWSVNYAATGMAYEHYDPAYRFGAQLAGGRNSDSSDWTQLEPEARRSWEVEHQGTWDQFKDSVRYAWERTRRKLSSSSTDRAA